MIDTARGVEGLTRGTGVHAAAVILSKTRLTDRIPLHMRASDGVRITGFDYPSCEAMGLVKMDFLGLRNLGVIDQAIGTSGRTGASGWPPSTPGTATRAPSSSRWTTPRPTGCWPRPTPSASSSSTAAACAPCSS